MNGFRTLNEATDLFQSVNGLGGSNNIFVVYKDTTPQGKGAGMGGLVGGMTSAMKSNEDSMKVFGTIYDGLLINQTENGLAIIPLEQPGAKMIYSFAKMEAHPEKYVFIPYTAIGGITVKNFALLNKKTQAIKINVNGTTIPVCAKVSDKDVPYQEANFAKFMQQYKKK